MKNKKQIIWFVLMIFTMIVIFYFSNQAGEKSDAVGNAVAQSINIPPTNEWIDESHTKLLFGLNLRKWAHIALFGLLGLSAYGWLMVAPKAIMVCLTYSVLDELHQVFVPGREAKAMDIFIDVLGFLIVIILFDAIKKIQKTLMRG